MALPSFTYSGVTYPAPPAGATTFPLTTSGGEAIPYLQKSHIHVYATTDNGATGAELTRPAQWNFNTAGTSVVLATGITAGTAIVLRRVTPMRQPYIEFAKGTLLTADELNEAERALLYIAQEAQDSVAQGFWAQLGQTVKLQDQLTGAWASDDAHVATTAAQDERFGALVQDTPPPAVPAGQQRQAGKLWIDDGALRLSYWDPAAGAWIRLDMTGPQGPQGPQGIPGPPGPVLDSLQFNPRNLLLNGDFRARNRGLSNAAPGLPASGYIADQWCWAQAGSSGLVYHAPGGLSQPQLTPDGAGSALVLSLTSATGADNYVRMWQPGPTLRAGRGRTFVLSFYAKAATPCSIATEFVMDYGSLAAGAANGIAPKKHSLTTSYQRFTAAVSFPLVPSGTSTAVGSNFFGVYFWFDAGSGFNARTDSLGHQPNNTIEVTGVMLECGTTPGAFETIPDEITALRAQRYYERATAYQQFPSLPAGGIFAISVPYRQPEKAFTPTAVILTNASQNLTNVSVVPGSGFALVWGTAVATGTAVVNVTYELNSSIVR